jgi:hypothetical protein
MGSRAIMVGRLLGHPLESETEVVLFDPPRAFGTQAIRGPKLATRFALVPEGDCTHVYVEVRGDVPGGVIGSRLAEGFLRNELTASLEHLRALACRPID